eukprot:Tbor_TRINITY_DN5967_c2_g5::TRINITY_DN5967_c2_g5_i1::g.19056::m.19056
MSATKNDKVHDVNELVEEEEIDVSAADGPKFAEVKVTSDDEVYDTVWEGKGTIKRFDEGENMFKDRGSGEAKILLHKVKKDHTFILRREGIGKLGAQHHLVKGMNVVKTKNNDCAVAWLCVKDYSDDDEGWPEKFWMKLATPEAADEFVKVFREVCAK